MFALFFVFLSPPTSANICSYIFSLAFPLQSFLKLKPPEIFGFYIKGIDSETLSAIIDSIQEKQPNTLLQFAQISETEIQIVIHQSKIAHIESQFPGTKVLRKKTEDAFKGEGISMSNEIADTPVTSESKLQVVISLSKQLEAMRMSGFIKAVEAEFPQYFPKSESDQPFLQRTGKLPMYILKKIRLRMNEIKIQASEPMLAAILSKLATLDITPGSLENIRVSGPDRNILLVRGISLRDLLTIYNENNELNLFSRVHIDDILEE